MGLRWPQPFGHPGSGVSFDFTKSSRWVGTLYFYVLDEVGFDHASVGSSRSIHWSNA